MRPFDPQSVKVTGSGADFYTNNIQVKDGEQLIDFHVLPVGADMVACVMQKRDAYGNFYDVLGGSDYASTSDPRVVEVKTAPDVATNGTVGHAVLRVCGASDIRFRVRASAACGVRIEGGFGVY